MNSIATVAATLVAKPAPLRCGDPYRDEITHCQGLRQRLLAQRPQLEASRANAENWITALRQADQPPFAVERLLAQFPISSAEGLALLRLAEALLRIPDTATAALLAADVLATAEFAGKEDEDLFAATTRNALGLGKKLLSEDESRYTTSLLARLGAQTFVRASRAAVGILAQQFVYASNIDDGIARAASSEHETVSFDMLGEGARSEEQASRYLHAYQQAIAATARLPHDPAQPQRGASVSIKLTALHPRFEEARAALVLPEMLERLAPLLQAAMQQNIPLTIDSEESERLELSLDLLEALIARCRPPPYLLGIAVQAYGRRALDVIDHLAELCAKYQVKLGVRLVKGAYWDAEIKRSQELGVADYPLFTDKSHTDLSYLACAQRLFELRDCLYPMFATHNAATVAQVQALAGEFTGFEFQRLHGMGEALYRIAAPQLKVPLRVYAPVGASRDLLAYLVRRLLENGANNSFVHQLTDPQVSAASLSVVPLALITPAGLPNPRALFGSERANSRGLDLQMRFAMRDALPPCPPVSAAPLGQFASSGDRNQAMILSPSTGAPVGDVTWASGDDVAAAFAAAQAYWPTWEARPVGERAQLLRRAADLLEARMLDYLPLLAQEAGKTIADGVAEVREAVDFLRYYAAQAERLMAPQTLPGPTGEDNILTARGRGVWVTISPWNFPLAIFAGQIAAALVTGNSVIAKPAEQTPLVAHRFVELLYEAGIPAAALFCLPGAGDIGAALTRHRACAGVAFTGSGPVARQIAQGLATKAGPLVPLIAETGGINVMLVDSTALPEQVIDAVVSSAFRSAGQRCSALRVLCVQDEIADEIMHGIAGALACLTLGDPLQPSTDVGPIIDRPALIRLQQYETQLAAQARCVGRSAGLPAAGHFFAPVAYECASLADIRDEVFGPLLHIVRYRAHELERLLEQINDLGYGLTLGIQSRIASRAQSIARKLRIGNVYVNRSMIGAVVGVQPFGGQGLSGTGPKAGGPHYLHRFVSEQTVSTNTAAAGGDAQLLAGREFG